ncbi:MAG: class I SAM-dependent methyltransferase [Proteobacteria bacterium]|nr:class I SAM-dependent methyltransferase [Pseudomonadota bacterium]
MEKIKNAIKKYWDWRSPSYGLDKDKSVLVSDRWEAVLKELIVNGSNRKRALDIGTGRGQFAFYLDRLGFDVTGIDISEKMIYHAQKFAKRHFHDIDFHTGDAEALTFPDHSFDVVVSRNLLWTLPNPEKAIAEWKRVMKPGGTLVISDGLWNNVTWREAHKIIPRLFKGNVTSFRFFLTYAGFLNLLPFYRGVSFQKASELLEAARFRDIKAYDTSCFEVHPYAGDIREKKNFFIAYARN